MLIVSTERIFLSVLKCLCLCQESEITHFFRVGTRHQRQWQWLKEWNLKSSTILGWQQILLITPWMIFCCEVSQKIPLNTSETYTSVNECNVSHIGEAILNITPYVYILCRNIRATQELHPEQHPASNNSQPDTFEKPTRRKISVAPPPPCLYPIITWCLYGTFGFQSASHI